MKASVIIPTYNRQEQFRHCINSLINQSSRDFEIIIVDESSDNSIKNIYENICINSEIDIYY